MSIEVLKNQIKETPISHIIGRYIDVTKKGQYFVAHCPFHNDTNPSLHINDQKGLYMCFVDQIGGDAIHFVMHYLKCSFMEALEDLCSKMGWDFESYKDKKNINPKLTLARKLLHTAAVIYNKIGTQGQAKEFKEFLSKRSLTKETVENYNLGHSPKHNVFYNYLLSIKDNSEKQKAIEIAKEIGLIKTYNGEEWIDTFRERIMFPIQDQSGHVIGFTSRATKDYQKAKYLNSKESFVFNKKALLYGIHIAKKIIREKDRIIVTEGNMDQISIAQNGFRESVAIMGVAMSESSAKILSSYTKNVYLALDNDEAGMKAAERVNTLFTSMGILPSYVDLSPYKDPDEFVVNLGSLAFEERLTNAKKMLDLLIDLALPEKIPEVIDRKIELLEKLFEIVSPLKMDLKATERLNAAAKKLGLSLTSGQILKSYEEYLESHKRRDYSQRSTPAPKKPAISNSSEITPVYDEAPPYFEEQDHLPHPDEQPSMESSLSHWDKVLLEIIITKPELFEKSEFKEILENINNSEVKQVILELKNLYFEIDEKNYEKYLLELVHKDELSSKIREGISLSLFKKDDKKLSQEDLDLDQMLKMATEDRLKKKKLELKSKHLKANNRDEAETILSELIQVERSLSELKFKISKKDTSNI
ncbi:MAG: DNA primase [Bacteriovoracaceae bacterium]